MAVRVVDAFEMVDVDHHHRQRAGEAAGAPQFLCAARHEIAPVADPRERVGAGLMKQLFLKLFARRDIVERHQQCGLAVIISGDRREFGDELPPAMRLQLHVQLADFMDCREQGQKIFAVFVGSEKVKGFAFQ